MKVLVISAVILAGAVAPVRFANSEPSPLSLEIGLLGGLSEATRFRAEGEPGALDVRYRGQYIGGVSTRLNFARVSYLGLGVQVETLFVGRGAEIYSGGEKLGASNMGYLDFPVLAVSRFELSRYVKSRIAIGPRFSVLLDAERIGRNGDTSDESDFWDPFDVGLLAAANLSLEVSDLWSVAIEARYDQGLTNIDDKDENPGRRHRAFFFLVGVEWELWREN
ncbi:porin family protein [Haliangium ochraceum]|nr:porin family protein [Haliangium ochraceum]